MTPRTTLAGLAGATLALALTACASDDGTSSAEDPASDSTGSGAVTLEDLDGLSFTAVDLTGGDRALVDDSAVTIAFEGDDLGASAGCNGLFAKVDVVDGVLRASDVGGTEMACADPLMDQETWFGEFLTANPDITYAAGDPATLTLSADGVDLTFEQVDAGSGTEPDEPGRTGRPDDGVMSSPG